MKRSTRSLLARLFSRRLVSRGILAAGLLSAPRAALADAKVDGMVKELKSATDWRVRLQAAAGLGASGDAAAVKPLCDALGADTETAVRQTAAAGLGKLGKNDGMKCLQAAESKESQAGVKKQIQKSIEDLKAAQLVNAPPPPNAESKYYVAIEITNKTKRPAAEVETIVRSAMVGRLLGKKGFAVAPKGEATADGKKIVEGKKLKGFILMITVEAPVYAGGNLSQSIRVAMASYPAKALQGEVAPKFTQKDTPKEDKASETDLMKACGESAVDSFVKVAPSL